MKPSSRTARTPSKLSDSLHHHLNMYALAASAAGVSMLVLTQPSEAKVIYTKTHQVIGQEGIYNLDLNHDGNVDFLIQQWGGAGSTSYLSNGLKAKEALGNAVQGNSSKYSKFATALKVGVRIGPKQHFVAGGYNGEVMASVTLSRRGGLSVRNRSLLYSQRKISMFFESSSTERNGPGLRLAIDNTQPQN
jgi:hypothetical protein